MLKVRWRMFFLVTLIVGLWGGAATTGVAAPLPPGMRLLRADPTSLAVEWIAPPVEVRPLDDGTVEVVAEGYSKTSQPGAPILPFASTLIALPPGASPHLRVLSVEEITQPLPAPVALAPRPEGVIRDPQGQPIGGAFAPAYRAKGQTTTPSPAVLEEIGVARGVRLARLTFYPARPEGDRLRIVRRLEAEIRWSGRKETLLAAASDPLLNLISHQVLNPQEAIPVSSPAGPAVLQSAGSGAPTAFIEVNTPGLYRVTHDDVAAFGFSGANPQNLRLFQGSQEVTGEWEGDDDTSFESGESLLFYAEPRFSRWTDVDVYRLVADTVPGQRMTSRSADPTGLSAGAPWVKQVAEENHIYTPDCFCGHLPAGRDGDRWTWKHLRRPDLATASFSIQTPAVSATWPASATLWLIGYTDVSANPDHRVDITLNGTSLGRVEWDGKTAVADTLSIPAGVLKSGGNTLSLNLPGITGVGVEGAWLDAFAVRYARSAAAVGNFVRFAGETGQQAYTVGLSNVSNLQAYDITDPLHPQRLTDVQVNGNAVTVSDPPAGGPRRYIVANANSVQRPVRIRAGYPAGSSNGADLLIITHPTFADALTPLVNLRQSQGLSTAVVNVLGIYDDWGDGRPDPEAIRAFIVEAYNSWNPRPAYVLLVGNGSFDPRRYQTGSPPTYIPPYLADVDPWAGETAADNRYVCVDGNDTLPDLAIGRLPVETVAEVQAVVDKILTYETDPLPGGWNANVILVADDADAAGNFVNSSDAHAAANVTSTSTVIRRYCTGLLPYADDCPTQERNPLRSALLSNWDQGGLLVQFTGHSSWQQWAAEWFFHLDDLAGLHNDRRWPIVVEMTCFTSTFHRPEPTLDASLVRLPGGGAVATWGPTGLGVSTGHGKLDEGFFQAVFADNADTVSQAALAGKVALAATGQNLDLLDTFTLLGDPATRFNRTIVPWQNQVHLPIILRSK